MPTDAADRPPYTPGGDLDWEATHDAFPAWRRLIDIPYEERFRVFEHVRSIMPLLPGRVRSDGSLGDFELTPERRRHVEMVLTGCFLAGRYSQWVTLFIDPAAQHSDHDWGELWLAVLFAVQLSPVPPIEKAELIGAIQATKHIMDAALHDADRHRHIAREAGPDIYGPEGYRFEDFKFIDLMDELQLSQLQHW